MEKSILLISIVGLAILTNVLISNESNVASNMSINDKKWVEWKENHRVSYETAQEEIYRYSVFLKTIELVKNHEKQNKTYTIGLNKFAAMTSDEFQAIYFSGPVAKPAPELYSKNLQSSKKPVSNLKQGNIDWTQTPGAVPPVTDMGQCQGSYAFAAVSNIESVYAIMASTYVQLSQEQIIQCSQNFGNQGCNGGTILDAYNYVSANKLCTDNQYPYTSFGGNTGSCNSALTGRYDIQGYDSIPSDCSYILNNLQSSPLTVQIVPSFEFQYYTGGVFSASNCPGTQAIYAMVMVGVNVNNYWLLQNSMGNQWGINGYMQLQYGNSCQVCTNTLQPSL